MLIFFHLRNFLWFSEICANCKMSTPKNSYSSGGLKSLPLAGATLPPTRATLSPAGATLPPARAGTSEYPNCRLLHFFEKTLCNQNYLFQNNISLEQNCVKPTHTKFEINWRLCVHYMNYSVCFAHCSKMAEIGRTWTYYIAKCQSSTPIVHFVEKSYFTDPN
jgi:hypothetical protein